METKLKKCIDLDIPVLVKVPNGHEAWAMDVQLGKLTKEDVVLSENDRINQRHLIWHFFEDEKFAFYLRKPALDTSTLFASTSVPDVEFLQLHTHDVEKLSASEEVIVTDFIAVMAFDEAETCFLLQESVPVSKYKFKLDSFSESPLIDALNEKIQFTGVDLNFVLVGEGITSDHEFNFPLKYKSHVETVASQCYIPEQEVSKLVFNDESYEKSVYHLEPEYHVSTSLLALSKAGFEINCKGVTPVSGGVSGYLNRLYGFSPSWSKSGAFLINPSSKFEVDTHLFTILKDVFKRYWLTPSPKSPKEISDEVIASLEVDYGIPSHCSVNAELIIRPDKLKSKKTLQANKIKAFG